MLNLAGPETLSVRGLAQAFGKVMGKTPEIAGTESTSALLSNGGLGHRLFGYPTVSVGELIEWTAGWVEAGLPLLDKPTGFQKRDGKF